MVCKILRFSKFLFNHRELEKTFNMWKKRFCSSFPTPYYLPHSDKWFGNAIKKYTSRFLLKKRFSKLLLNLLYFAKNLTWGHDTRGRSFSTVYHKPIWAMLAEIQHSTGGSSGRTTQTVKLQQPHVHHNPRAKSAN